MSIKTSTFTCIAALLSTMTIGLSTPVQAGNAGAFIGGAVTAKVLSNMSRRTEAEEQQAANSSRQAAPAAAAPAPAPAAQTPQQRLDQLDKLAAGGYITPEEYKAKKKAIVDSM